MLSESGFVSLVIIGIGGGGCMDLAKTIFKRYFEKVLDICIENKDDETLLHEALQKIISIYQEFGIATKYEEVVENPNKHQALVDIIDSFGPMESQFMPVPTEKLAKIIEDAISGNLN